MPGRTLDSSAAFTSSKEACYRDQRLLLKSIGQPPPEWVCRSAVNQDNRVLIQFWAMLAGQRRRARVCHEYIRGHALDRAAQAVSGQIGIGPPRADGAVD